MRVYEPQGRPPSCCFGTVISAGVPPFLKHVPVLGGLLRGISLRAIRRMMEDIEVVVQMVGRCKAARPLHRGKLCVYVCVRARGCVRAYVGCVWEGGGSFAVV